MTDKDALYWRGYARQTALGLGLRGEDVEDAAQDALVALTKAWDIPASGHEGYYKQTVKNSVRMTARTQRANVNDWLSLSDQDLTAKDEYELVDRAIDARSELREIAKGFDLLSGRQKDVLSMVALEHSAAEIAEALGTTTGSVHWSTWDARRRLSQGR